MNRSDQREMTLAPRRTGSESGFSLVETLLAAALLGTVLISVVALFVLGSRSVKSGKQLTKATGLGIEMMEDFRRMNFNQAYKAIGGTCDESSREWRSEAGSKRGDPPFLEIPDPAGDAAPEPSCDFDNANWGWPDGDDQGRPTLCRWAEKAEAHFGGSANGAVRVKIDGFNAIPADQDDSADGNIDFCDARLLRIRVTVEWEELTRPREVTFETLKF